MKRTAFIAILLSVVLLTGCADSEKTRSEKTRSEKTRLEKEIDELAQQETLAKRKIANCEQTILSLQNEANGLAGKIRDRNSEVVNYMSDHKAAIGCMVAAGYSLGKDNLFSKEVNEYIAAGAILCTIVVLFDEVFRQEIVDVIAELERADADIKSFQSQIATVKSKIERERTNLAVEKIAFDGVSQKIRGLQTQLAALS